MARGRQGHERGALATLVRCGDRIGPDVSSLDFLEE